MLHSDSTARDIACRIKESEYRERARVAALLDDIAAFEERGAARLWGYASTTDWLVAECGMSRRTAREYVRVAKRLVRWREVADALALCQLSYSHVREITRAVETENETELLRACRGKTAGQIELHVQQLRSSRAADLDVANRGRAKRCVTYFQDELGSVHMFVRLPAEQGVAVIEALETRAAKLAGDPDDPARPPDWTRAPLAARRADAFYELITGGGAKTELVLHADAEALACQAERDEPRAGSVLFLRDGPAIPSELGRRLTCDCFVSVNELNLGRAQRLITAQQRKALEIRDGRVCQFPGCERTHGLQGHHIIHWILGGRTDLDNLALFCAAHHYLLHEGRFTARRLRDGTLAFADPRGHEIHSFPMRAPPIFAATG